MLTLRLILSWIFLTAIYTANAAIAAPPSKSAATPEEWVRLDPSNPEHEAIRRWHRSIIKNDFKGYLLTVPKIKELTVEMHRQTFDYLRTTTPLEILISSQPRKTNPNGSKEFYVVGCTKLKGDPREWRVLSIVTPLNIDGELAVSASGFGPSWANSAHACPIM